MRMLSLFLVVSCLLPLAACAAPAAVSDPVMASQPAESAQSTPIESGSVVLDKSCRTDADCEVKDVGNCCGYYPACVNKDSQTDPAGARAQCRSKGRVGVCGFPAISSCECHNGQCASAGNRALPFGRPLPAPNPVK